MATIVGVWVCGLLSFLFESVSMCLFLCLFVKLFGANRLENRHTDTDIDTDTDTDHTTQIHTDRTHAHTRGGKDTCYMEEGQQFVIVLYICIYMYI